jgi:two-component system CheB/CheR fusion protein
MPGSGSGGAGLGLYIAKEITMAHGARLNLQSEAGHGSLFTIELPTATAG